MKKQIKHVCTFHDSFGIKNNYTPTEKISEDVVLLRHRLMAEENEEYLEEDLNTMMKKYKENQNYSRCCPNPGEDRSHNLILVSCRTVHNSAGFGYLDHLRDKRSYCL